MLQSVFLSFAVLLLIVRDESIAEENRTVHQPDLTDLVQRVLTGPYTVDPLFVEFISHPSSVYTDLYGLHALQDLNEQEILDDFVPHYATLVGNINHTVDLQFKNGWNATFYPHALLDIKGIFIPRDHLYIGGNNASELISNLKDFRRVLADSHTESKYLLPNPFYPMEKITNDLYYSGKPTIPVTFDPNMDQFHSVTDGMLIYPDPVHGDLSYFNIFMTRLRLADIQWLGMEMLTSSMQSTLDHFCMSPMNSSEYINARLNLTNYFLTAWTPYFKLNITSGEQSPYFQAIDLVREKRGRVYGLDLDNVEFIIFRYGESDFGAAVRSHNWAMSVPITGRGILFGGSAHFSMNRSANVQDFLHERQNNVQLFTIRPLGPSGNATSDAIRLVSHLFLIFSSFFIYFRNDSILSFN